MCGIAISRFGLTSYEFYHLSPVEFYYALQDAKDREMCRMEITFNSMRKQTMYWYNAQVEEAKRQYDPLKFMPFPWESPRKQSVEEMKQQMINIVHTFKKKK